MFCAQRNVGLERVTYVGISVCFTQDTNFDRDETDQAFLYIKKYSSEIEVPLRLPR